MPGMTWLDEKYPKYGNTYSSVIKSTIPELMVPCSIHYTAPQGNVFYPYLVLTKFSWVNRSISIETVWKPSGNWSGDWSLLLGSQKSIVACFTITFYFSLVWYRSFQHCFSSKNKFLSFFLLWWRPCKLL